MIAHPRPIPMEPGCLLRRLGTSAVNPRWSVYDTLYWTRGRVWRMRTESEVPYDLALVTRLFVACPDHRVEITPPTAA